MVLGVPAVRATIVWAWTDSENGETRWDLSCLAPNIWGGTLTIYQWRCIKQGHVIERTRTNILQSISRGVGPCPVCAGRRRGGGKGQLV